MPTLSPDLLESLLGDRLDERTRALLAMLPSGEEQGAAGDDLRNDGAERAARAARLRRHFEVMAGELRELRHRNAALADALGACGNCWGESPTCPICRGEGRAGAYPVDPELYSAIVEPAVRSRERSGERDDAEQKGDVNARHDI